MIVKFEMPSEDMHYQGRSYKPVIPSLMLEILNTSLFFKLTMVRFLNIMMEPSGFSRLAVFELTIDYDTIVDPNINVKTIQEAFIAQRDNMKIFETETY
jgi:hypothetical protein